MEIPKFVVTGFGPFGEFKQNPSSDVAKNVVETINSKYSARFEEIPTSIQGVDKFYNSLEKENTFIVHIGLHDGSKKPNLEMKARNILNFSIPDVEGNAPKLQKIDQELELDERILQTIDFKSFLPKDIDFCYSKNAGAYICNYAYFNALKNVGIKTCGAIFIHIPSFSTYSLEKSTSTIVAIIEEIVKHKDLLKK